jgi:multimeric flavodoxin WrbA
MIIRKLGDTKPKILLIQGSPRSDKSCSGQMSKSEKVCDYLLDKWSPFVDFEYVNLSVGQVTIQPCKGCVSTANGMHCHWKCTCYTKNSKHAPDLMYEKDIYDKLEQCDGFMIVSPVHWYSVSTQVKAMFDRLVCANLTLTKEQAIQILGDGNIKTADLTGQAELEGNYKNLLKNHLEGKWASFFVHGDDGANDYDGNQPSTGDISWDVRNSVMPLVYQCRYSMMNCPDDLVEAFYINKGLDYYEANLQPNQELYDRADALIDRLMKYLSESKFPF